MDGFCLTNNTGNIIEVNDSYSNMTGYSKDELTSMDISDFELNMLNVTRYQNNEKACSQDFDRFESKHRRKDGIFFDVEVSVHFHENNGGECALFIRDITERKLAENKLNESEQKYRLLVENQNDALINFDQEGKIFFVNDVFCSICGMGEDQLLGQDLLSLIPEENLPCAQYSLKRVLQPPYQASYEDRLMTVDGWKWISWSLKAVFSEDGKISSIIAVGRDINDQKISENELKLTRDRLALATKAGGVGIWDFDIQNNVLVWDKQMFKLYGVSESDFKGAYEAWEASVNPDDLARSSKELQMAIRGEAEFDTEFRILWPDASVHTIRALASVQRDKSGNPVRMVGTNWDITETKRAENALITIAETSVFSEEDIFRVMVREIAVFQDVKYALIAEVDTNKSNTANTIAVWNNGEYSENFSYPLIGTPCNNVLQDGECFYSSKVQDIFPEDILLKEMGVESYYGSPLINSQGIAIGVMVLLDDKPMVDSTFTRSVLNSFASRAAAEIERHKAQEKIKLNEERLQCFANIMEHEIHSFDEFLKNVVDEIVAFTKSEIGYLYFYNEETEQFKFHSYSKNIYDKCNLDVCTFFNLEESGVWSQAVKQRKALIINDLKVPHPAKKGFPKGHVDLNRFMTIPVFHLNRIVAVVAVGNKLTDYIPEDIEQLTVLMDSVWKVVEQKKADEKLKLSEDKLKSVLEGAKMGFWELDLESRTISADLHALKMLGLNEHGSNLSAEYFYSLVHSGDANTLRQLIMESAEKCESVSMDFRLRSLSGGWKWVSIKGKPLYTNESTTPSSFAGLLSDIDQRIKSEEATLYARIAADDSNRIKKDFIQNVSHELRTPLTAVLGFCELLLDHDLNDTQQKYATNILQGGQNLLTVVDKMIDFSDTESTSNIGELRIEAFSISELVSDIISLLSTAARKKNIEVTTKNICSSDNLIADLQKMKRILYNLLENAIKFTEDGGRININISSHENEVIFSVIDNGIGIEATYMDKIFDPFTQVDGSTTRRYGGTGLGLALTKKYVEMQGGSISVESEVGKGSSFTVTIPINSKLQSNSAKE